MGHARKKSFFPSFRRDTHKTNKAWLEEDSERTGCLPMPELSTHIVERFSRCEMPGVILYSGSDHDLENMYMRVRVFVCWKIIIHLAIQR